MRRTLAEAAGLSGASAAVYGSGACPTIYVGDSGELVAAAHTLGVPHPSGYPLYVLLGKLWSLLVPIGSVAARLSWFSVVTAALAVGVCYVLARRLHLHRGPAALAAAMLALSPSFWSQANVQRVYSLNALFVVLTLLVFVEWQRSPHRRRFFLLFLVAGLGASNHTVMGLIGLTVAACAWWSRPACRRLADWGFAALGFGLGLTPYLFLMFRSRYEPRLDWGDPESLSALVSHVLRLTHWSRAWLETWSDALVIGGDYLMAMGAEFLWLGLPLIVAGAWWLRGRGWPSGLLFLILVVNFLSMMAHGSHADLFIWHRYYIPSYIVGALLIGAAAQWMSETRLRRAALVLWLLPIGLLISGWRANDRSRFELAEAFSRSLLAGLPPGAHLAASDDNILFVLIYLDLVEGARPDIDLIMQGVGGGELPPLRFEPDEASLYFTHHPNWEVPGLSLEPFGLTFRVAREGSEPVASPELPESLPGEEDPRVPKDYLTQNLIGQFHYMKGLGLEGTDWPGAVREFERAALAAPRNDVLFYNLGLILKRNARLELAREAFVRADRINPRGIVSNRTALASDRIEALDRELAVRPGEGGNGVGWSNTEKGLMEAMTQEESR